MFSISCNKIINSSVKQLDDESMNTVKYSIVSFEDGKKKRKKRIPKKCTLCTMVHVISFALLYILILNIHVYSEKGDDLHLHLSCRNERNLGEFIPMLRKCFTGNHEMDEEEQLKTRLKTDEKEQLSSKIGEKEKVNSKMDEKEKVNSKMDEKEKVNSKMDEKEKVNSKMDEKEKVDSKMDENEKANSKMDEKEKVNSKMDEKEKVNSKMDENEKANSKMDEKEKANSKMEEKEKVNSKMDEKEKVNSKMDENEKANSKMDEKEKVNSKMDEKEKVNSKMDENEKANSKMDEKEKVNSKMDENEKANNKMNENEKANSKMDENEKANNKRDYKSAKQNYVEEICNTLNRCGPYISVEQMEDTYHKLHDYQRRKFLTMMDELWHFTVSYAGKHQISEDYRSKYWWECSNILTCNLMKMHKSDLDNFALFLKKQSNSTEEYKRFVMEKIKLWNDFTFEKKKMWTALLKAQLKKY